MMRTLMLVAVVSAAHAIVGEVSLAMSAQVINSAILDSRSRLRSAHFVISLTKFDARRRLQEDIRLDSYVSGRMVHEDMTVHGVRSTRCYDGEWFYEYDRVPVNAVAPALIVRKIGPSDPNASHPQIYEPTKLMMYACWYLAASRLPATVLVGSPLQEDFVVRSATLGQEPCLKVTCRVDRGGLRSNASYWVATRMGYNVLRMEVNDSAGSASWIQCSLTKIAEGIWFPNRIHFENLTNGALEMREDLTVVTDRVNEVIPVTMFQPIGMDVPANTIVAHYPAHPQGGVKWDGTRIVPISVEEFIRLSTPQASLVRQRSNRWLVWGSIASAVGAAIVFWRASRRRCGAPDAT